MKKMLLIVNPCSGQKKAKKYLADIIDVFNRADYKVMVHITEKEKDGEAAVLKFASEADIVVCCGGDGTFNETISGVLKGGFDIPVGYIPCGSTNDFAAGMHLSSDLIKAAKDIVDGIETSLDVGCFGDRYFSYVASFGIFTKTSYTTPQSMKNVLGHTAYVLSGIQELSQLTKHKVRVELCDGSVIEDSFIFGAISNATSVGGVLTLSERLVDLHDGKFEVILIREPKGLNELAECIQALAHQTYDCNMLTITSASKVKVITEDSMDWTLDGEWEHGHDSVEVECLNAAVRVMCPKH